VAESSAGARAAVALKRAQQHGPLFLPTCQTPPTPSPTPTSVNLIDSAILPHATTATTHYLPPRLLHHVLQLHHLSLIYRRLSSLKLITPVAHNTLTRVLSPLTDIENEHALMAATSSRKRQEADSRDPSQTGIS